MIVFKLSETPASLITSIALLINAIISLGAWLTARRNERLAYAAATNTTKIVEAVDGLLAAKVASAHDAGWRRSPASGWQ